MPTSSKLTPILQERQFWAAFLIGAPLLVFGYAEVWDALRHGASLDVPATIAAFSVNPLTLYLAARQYPRGKSVEAYGAEQAAAIADVPTEDEIVADDDEPAGNAPASVMGQAGDELDAAAEVTR